MHRLLSIAFTLFVLWWPALGTAAEDIILVVVHPENPVKVMEQSDLRPIVRTEKITWDDGSTIQPINLPESDLTRHGFDSAVLGLDPERVARFWVDRKIRGGNRPPMKAPNPSVVLLAVSKKKDAIGYLPAEALVPDKVKVVAKIMQGRVLPP